MTSLLQYIDSKIALMESLISPKKGQAPYGVELSIYRASLTIYKDMKQRVMEVVIDGQVQ